MKKFFAPALCLSIFASTAATQDWYVDKVTTSNNSGKSWQNAFGTIAEALAVARSGDEIWVALPKAVAIPSVMVVPDGVVLIGGFEPGATSVHGKSLTTVGGFVQSTRFELGSGCVLDGFAIVNGRSPMNGGSLLVRGAGIEVRNCSFTLSDILDGSGSAVFVDRKSPTSPTDVKFINCLFSGGSQAIGNAAKKGHALVVKDSRALLLHCLFQSRDYSGAFVEGNASADFVNSAFDASGRYGLEIPSSVPQVAVLHCRFSDKNTRQVLRAGRALTTENAINSQPGWRNNTFDNNLSDKGMLHPDLPLVDLRGNPRLIMAQPFSRNLLPDIGPFEGLGPVLSVTSRPRPGAIASVRFGAGTSQILGVGLGTTTGVFLPDAGYFLLDPASMIVVGFAGQSLGVPIPASTPIGTAVFFQGVSIVGTPYLPILSEVRELVVWR